MISNNISDILGKIDNASSMSKYNEEKVLLVAVTKTRSADEINEAIRSGITDIGENKVQEIIDKYDDVLPAKWHMIGHLQTNKVKYIIDKVDLIHSVDSMRLAQEIDKRAKSIKKTMDILIQVNSAMEESKFGSTVAESKDLLYNILSDCENIRVRGFMCMAPFEENPEDVRQVFADVRELFDEAKTISHDNLDIKYLSMGMTNDYEVAIEEGSNLVRVGTAIFGNRFYQ